MTPDPKTVVTLAQAFVLKTSSINHPEGRKPDRTSSRLRNRPYRLADVNWNKDMDKHAFPVQAARLSPCCLL
jgi:hypothetical protein